jgi:hypothetical protein
MTSTVLGVPGGSFPRNDRFKSSNKQGTPAMKYDIPSFPTDKHMQSPLYLRKHKAPNKDGPPHPGARNGFMIGKVEKDINHYKSNSEVMGPNKYYPGLTQTKPQVPRAKFGQDRRFKSMTKQYVTKEHNMANLCTASPGPCYATHDTTYNVALQKDKAPEYSFRSRGDTVSDRGAFLKSRIKGGYIYQSQPATSGKANVSAATYSGDHNVTKQKAPRALQSKQDRFYAGQYQSKKASRANKGKQSPGPCMYAPDNYTINANKRFTIQQAGVFK